MSYEINSTADDRFIFNLKAENQQVILTSQVYEKKQSALVGIASVQQNGAVASNFEHKVSVAGQPYFVLKAANGEIIGKSQMYSSNEAAQLGVASVQANAASAIVDTTV